MKGLFMNLKIIAKQASLASQFINQNYFVENKLFLSGGLNLTDENSLSGVNHLANLYYEKYSLSELKMIEDRLVMNKSEHPLSVHLAIKLAHSKRFVETVPGSTHVSLVFAMYHEQNRMLTKMEHPNGEDFISRKMDQLDWLFENTEHTWDMVMVDDGCDEGSGKLAEQILKEKGVDGDKARVLFLQDAIDQRFPVVDGMLSTKESMKGGAVAYGLWYSTRVERENHIVIFTDADLSTHLGQVGLLVEGIVSGKKQAAIGSRALQGSVKLQSGGRHYRGKLFSYLQKKLNMAINYIIDTQCGFKGFTADSLRTMLEGQRIENKFAFDSELLIRLETMVGKDSAVEVPIAWIDSESESTTSSLKPYLPMLKQMAAMYRQYLPHDPLAETFAQFVESIDEEKWEQLLNNIPEVIQDITDTDIASFKGITADELSERAQAKD
jgi:hypothetical protein